MINSVLLHCQYKFTEVLAGTKKPLQKGRIQLIAVYCGVFSYD